MSRSRVIKLVLLTTFFSMLIAGSANETRDYCYAELVVPTCKAINFQFKARSFVYIDCPGQNDDCLEWLMEEYIGKIGPCEDEDCEPDYIPEFPDEVIIWEWPNLFPFTQKLWLNKFVHDQGNSYCVVTPTPPVSLSIYDSKENCDIGGEPDEIWLLSSFWQDMFCSFCPEGEIWIEFKAIFNPRNIPSYTEGIDNPYPVSLCWDSSYCGDEGAWFLPVTLAVCPPAE